MRRYRFSPLEEEGQPSGYPLHPPRRNEGDPTETLSQSEYEHLRAEEALRAAEELAKGDVLNGSMCTCSHMASAHANVSAGKNSGACSMANCTCKAFKAKGSHSTEDVPVVEQPTSSATDPVDSLVADGLVLLSPEEVAAADLPERWHAFLFVEGLRTTDGRAAQVGSGDSVRFRSR